MIVTREDCAVVVTEFHAPKGMIKAMGWSLPGLPFPRCFLDVMLSRQLASFHLQELGQGALHCGAYIVDYRKEPRAHGLTLYHLTLAVDGGLWRDDDTPVDGFNEVWGIDWGAAPVIPPVIMAP